MNYIDSKQIKFIKPLGKGCFSNVYLISLDNELYAYKVMNLHKYNIDVLNKLSLLTEEDFDNSFYIPLCMVDKNNIVVGYITTYNEFDISFDYKLDKLKKIELLCKLKNKIELLHNRYGLIHNDICIDNILYNKNSKDIKLIDFDASCKIGENVNRDYIRVYLKNNFLKNNSYSKDIDIFSFNINALLYLLSLQCYSQLVSDVRDGYIAYPNNDVKKLTLELMPDYDKKFSGEYIIDYM